MGFIVAIDGPSGSGKGTITKILSSRLGFMNIDTGATYRTVALATLKANINIEKEEEVVNLLNTLSIKLVDDNGIKVYLNEQEVTDEIRTPEITMLTANISRIPAVRYKLVDLQRKIAQDKDVIMEGRDIGTYVFPKADVKIYLDASAEERARRRQVQNVENSINTTYEEVLSSIKERDKIDLQREIGALKQAEDAIYIDSSNMQIDEVIEKILSIIKEKI